MNRIRILNLLCGCWLSAAALVGIAVEPAPGAIDCPAQLTSGSQCYAGKDNQGAWYWIALPPKWSAQDGRLIIHTHGGPSLGEPNKLSSLADLERFAVMVNEGYAWAGSSYRRGGFGVRSAAEDTDNLRRLVWQQFGQPAQTFLHGQSWGASIALKTAELYNPSSGSNPIYSGMLLTNGLVSGASYAYDFRADLRAVYQFYCANHPAASEPEYPLWQGLPLNSSLTAEQLRERVNQCTGVDLSPQLRTPDQTRALRNILAVVRIAESSLQGHMAWATFTFRDLVMRRLQGKNPFTNRDVIYRGSDDDQALNEGVSRFDADLEAVKQLRHDADVSGRLTVPTISLHAIEDPTAFVELEHAFHAQVAAAGAEPYLLQVFTRENNHQRLSPSEYAAALGALQQWVDSGRKAEISHIAQGCIDKDKQYGGHCFIDEQFRPGSLSQRVAPRTKPGLPKVAGMEPPVIKLNTGLAAGVRDGGVDRFLGLPYAAAPLGAHRWEKPRPPLTWTGEYPATRVGARCPQSLSGLAQGTEREDCLYLNIYRPSAAAKKPRAIYLYIHGGGAVAGSANDLDATSMALAGDLIVVAANYRLGALGFMNSEPLAVTSADKESGNYALDDVKAALRWLKQNAQALGGDPNKITLGGESAGGTLVCPLLVDTDARELFQQAIISSDDCLHDIDSLPQARERAAQLSQRLGCASAKAPNECLRRKSASEIIAAGGFAAPTARPLNAFAAITQQQWKPLPILLGANRDEGRIAGPSFAHFNQAQFNHWLTELLPPEKNRAVQQRYGKIHAEKSNPIPYRVSDIITDSGMRGLGGCSIVALVDAITSASKKMASSKNIGTYFYEFNGTPVQQKNTNNNFDLGSAHAVELAYLWPDSPEFLGLDYSAEQIQLSQQMLSYWVNFINSGNPNGAGLPRWPDAKQARYMALQLPIKSNPKKQSRAQALAHYRQYHHCDLWASTPWIMDRGEPK